jgi:hypothetical protein
MYGPSDVHPIFVKGFKAYKNNVKGSRTFLILGKASPLCCNKKLHKAIKYNLTQLY